MYIYKITNIKNQKVYIGKTEQKLAKNRFSAHKSLLRRNKHYNTYLQNSWNKYGESSFKFEVLEQFNPEMNFDINKLEKYWIKFYDSMNPSKGYNLTEGGEGSSGFKHTEDSLKKISLTSKGRKMSDENKEKARQRGYGNSYASGVKHSEEGLKNIASACKNRIWTEESKDKIRQSKEKFSKAVICIETSEIFKSVSAVARFLKTSCSNIRKVCNGQAKICKGYTFQWHY